MKFDSCDIDKLILEEEARHDEEIELIARNIIDEAEAGRIVLIGGPSSSGKTTFSKRLTYHLNNQKINTLTISTDDYFVGDEKNPRDENGQPDYEHIEAVNLKQLNNDLLELLAGKEVRMPRFDFLKHAPSNEYHTEQIDSNGVIIIEGLHSLNPALTPEIPDTSKFLILAKTISSPFRNVCRYREGDGRLIRRIIRDSKYRNRQAAETIALWESVRIGESRWIKPFEINAEYNFDTSLAYEPVILTKFARPLLRNIPKSSPSYAKARQLLQLLEPYPEHSDDKIPGYSILREYIGGSSLEY